MHAVLLHFVLSVLASPQRTVDLREHRAVVAIANARGVVCTGTLIGRRTVLTARHCLPASKVLFGVDSARPDEVLKVVGSKIPGRLPIDVALLFLDRDAPEDPYFWRADREAPHGYVRLVGFGREDPDLAATGGTRHLAEVHVDGWGCDAPLVVSAGCRPDVEMVVPRRAGADTCSGDSGGPVLEAHGSSFRVVAVTSRSVANALLVCGDGGVYTRTDVIAAWLGRNVR